jgi:hypothetical protein
VRDQFRSSIAQLRQEMVELTACLGVRGRRGDSAAKEKHGRGWRHHSEHGRGKFLPPSALPPSLPPSLLLPSPPSQHDSPPSSTRASLGSDRKSANLTDQVADLEEGLEGLREQKDARLRRIRATRERSGGGEEGREERRERGRDG